MIISDILLVAGFVVPLLIVVIAVRGTRERVRSPAKSDEGSGTGIIMTASTSNSSSADCGGSDGGVCN